jgi:hypothetical protein
MPIPVFEQQLPEQAAESMEVKKEKVSPWSVLLTVVLMVILITMGEYALKDSNRVFNPYYEACYLPTSYNSLTFLKKIGTPEESCDMKTYEGTKLLLHLDLGAPLLLFSVLIYFLVRGKKISGSSRVMTFAWFVFVIWMLFRIAFETESYLVKHYPLAGKYVVFVSIAFVCIGLILFVQNKLRKKAEA